MIGYCQVEYKLSDILVKNGSRMFDAYLFADYSGAKDRSAQRKAIKVAYGEGTEAARLVDGQYDRTELLDLVLEYLLSATQRGLRVCFGFDHILGIPYGLARELGISDFPWRRCLRAFITGSYAADAPAFREVGRFGEDFNRWTMERGRHPYFWSATKSNLYGVPQKNPQKGQAKDTGWRLTDRCASRGQAPKPFNRLGDNGSVGGQSLYGMANLCELMDRCDRAGIKVRFWPFDGLAISDPKYENAHVGVEPYPSGLRPSHVKQSDADDALYSALAASKPT